MTENTAHPNDSPSQEHNILSGQPLVQQNCCPTCRKKLPSKEKFVWGNKDLPAVWTWQDAVLTGFGVGVSISLGAAVRRCLLVVLLLGEAEGKSLGGAGYTAGLWISQPAVTAALLGTVRKMECHTALGLEQEMFYKNIL